MGIYPKIEAFSVLVSQAIILKQSSEFHGSYIVSQRFGQPNSDAKARENFKIYRYKIYTMACFPYGFHENLTRVQFVYLQDEVE